MLAVRWPSAAWIGESRLGLQNPLSVVYGLCVDRYASVVLGTAIDRRGHLYTLGFSPQEGGYAFVDRQVDPLAPWHVPEAAQVYRAPATSRDDARALLRSWTTDQGMINNFLGIASF